MKFAEPTVELISINTTDIVFGSVSCGESQTRCEDGSSGGVEFCSDSGEQYDVTCTSYERIFEG